MDGNVLILPKLITQEVDTKSFIDPMQFTIAILHEVNDYVLYEFSTQDEFKVNSIFIKKIFEKLQNSY